MKLLIAEDDRDLRYALEIFFQRNRFNVDCVDNGEDALSYLNLEEYDAAVLDVMMPAMDGISVVRRLRERKNATPVLLLTAKSEIEDRVEGLEAGANDYLPKPFDVRELLARVRVLTRSKPEQTAKLPIGKASLDTVCFLLMGPDGACSLTNKEYQTLLLLIQSEGAPVSADRILRKVWTAESGGQENTLWTTVYQLRKKLDSVGAEVTIQNRRNQGYVLEAQA